MEDPKGFAALKSLRTFQGDVAEAMKKQNTSVLSIALAEQNKQGKTPQPTPKGKPIDLRKSERLIEEIPGSRPVPRPPQPKVESKVESMDEKRTRLAGGNYAPIESSPLSTPPVPQPKFVAPKVDTYRESVLPEKPVEVHQSVVFRDAPPRFDPDFKKNVLTIIASIVLILLGVGSVIGFYILQKSAPSRVVTVPVASSIISYDQKQTIVVTHLERNDLIQALSDAKSSGAPLTAGEILYTALVASSTSSNQISTADFFALLQTSASGQLIRAMSNQFMFGYFESDQPVPFLLINLTDFDNAYSGMLAWEKTMNADIGVIFSPRSIPVSGYVPAGTTTIAGASSTTLVQKTIVNTDLSQTNTFKDITIENKDARVLQNFRGDPILLYSFLDNNTLLITSDQNALTQILQKFIAAKLVH